MNIRTFNLFFLSVLGIIVAPVSVLAEIILPIRCHMGGCSEFRFDRKEKVKANENGTLYKIYGAVRFIKMGQQPINNFGVQIESYIYCSQSKPMKAFALDGKWEVIKLSPAQYEPRPDAGSVAQYWTTCHNIIGPDFSLSANRKRAFELGYTQEYLTGRQSVDDLDSIFSLDTPQDLRSLKDGFYRFESPEQNMSNSQFLLAKRGDKAIAQVIYGFDILACSVGKLDRLGLADAQTINLYMDRTGSYYKKSVDKFINLSGYAMSYATNPSFLRQCKQDLLEEGIDVTF